MKLVIPLVAVAAIAAIVYLGVEMMHLNFVFGVVLPYLAVASFLIGFVYRVLKWTRSPVPFNITTTAGQQKSLPWIKNSNLENPHNRLGVLGRMALEVLLFRSLFRNTMAKRDGDKLIYTTEPVLWLAGLIFHWSFLIIFVRHLRFFMEPIPGLIHVMDEIDGMMQVGIPTMYLTDLTFVLGVTLLFLRRVGIPQIRFISLPADFFPLFVLLTIAASGILMRYFLRVDLASVKEMTLGLVTFSPKTLQVPPIYYIHVTFVSVLFGYFPFSKLMHMGGVFMSPTRNMPNNSRMVRHINPWNPEVAAFSYAEYEDLYRKPMKAAGLPVEKDE